MKRQMRTLHRCTNTWVKLMLTMLANVSQFSRHAVKLTEDVAFRAIKLSPPVSGLHDLSQACAIIRKLFLKLIKISYSCFHTINVNYNFVVSSI